MHIRLALTVAALLAMPSAAFAQPAADPTVRAIDRAGEAAAAKGAPGTLVPATPGAAVAPGIESPVTTAAPATAPPKPAAPAPSAK